MMALYFSLFYKSKLALFSSVIFNMGIKKKMTKRFLQTFYAYNFGPSLGVSKFIYMNSCSLFMYSFSSSFDEKSFLGDTK